MNRISIKRSNMLTAYLRNEDIPSSNIARYKKDVSMHKIVLAKPSGYFRLIISYLPDVNEFCYSVNIDA